jgi:hypothetical protein
LYHLLSKRFGKSDNQGIAGLDCYPIVLLRGDQLSSTTIAMFTELWGFILALYHFMCSLINNKDQLTYLSPRISNF